MFFKHGYDPKEFADDVNSVTGFMKLPTDEIKRDMVNHHSKDQVHEHRLVTRQRYGGRGRLLSPRPITAVTVETFRLKLLMQLVVKPIRLREPNLD